MQSVTEPLLVAVVVAEVARVGVHGHCFTPPRRVSPTPPPPRRESKDTSWSDRRRSGHQRQVSGRRVGAVLPTPPAMLVPLPIGGSDTACGRLRLPRRRIG